MQATRKLATVIHSHFGPFACILTLAPCCWLGCGDGTAAFPSFTRDVLIEGRVRDHGGFGLPGVVVAASGVRQAGVTDAAGRYQIAVPDDWSGTVTPNKDRFQFDPTELRMPVANGADSSFDFVARLLSTPATAAAPVVLSAPPVDTCGDPNFEIATTSTRLVAVAPAVVRIVDGAARAEVLLDGSGSQIPKGSRVEWRSGGVPIAFDLRATIDLTIGVHQLELISIGPDGTEESTTVVVRVITDGPQSIYVDGDDPAANDANSGTSAAPLATIQAGVDKARPGDVVIVRSAPYFRNHPSVNRPVVTIQNRHGTAEQPITITADTGERPFISGIRPGSQRGNTGWAIVDSSWLVINGFHFGELNGVGLDIEGSAPGATHHIDVTNCTADRCSQGPNTFVGALRAVGPVQYVSFKNCMISNSSSGIVLRESPVQTRETATVPPKGGNNALGAPGGSYTSDLPESEWSDWCGWDQVAPRFCTIENCLSFDNRQVPEHSDGFATRYAVDCVIKDNIAFGNADDNFDLLGGTRLTVTGNIAFDGNPENTEAGDGNGIKVGVRGGLDCLVAYNIAFNNRRMGLDMGDTERGRVFHNTIANNGDGHGNGFGMWFEGGRASTGHQVMFNILLGNGRNTSRGDYGAARHVGFAASNYNSMSDNHNHNFAGPGGAQDRISDNVQFVAPNSTVDTEFAVGISVTERLNRIRQQVRNKYKLVRGSPLRDSAIVVPGVNNGVTVTGGNWGAVQD